MLGILAAAMAALAIGLFGTAALIKVLSARGIGQPIHDAVSQHAAKAGTPTMGGLVVSMALPAGYIAGLAAGERWPSRIGLVVLACVLAAGGVGALDDWLKVRRGRNTLGLRERQKTALILAVAGGFVANGLTDSPICTTVNLTRCGVLPNLGRPGWAVFVVAVIWFTTNSVNFTDGEDGLLAGCALPPLITLAAIGFWEFRHPSIYHVPHALDIALLAIAAAAGCAGLLWWNAAPAQVFMGDTGSLAIGTAIAMAALSLHVELLIPVFGAVFVMEGASSLAQRYWFRLTGGRRLFRMAPIHYHFEMLGWPETTVVIRFWIISALASAAAAGIFYADAIHKLP